MKHFDAPQRMLAGLDAHATAALIAAASDVALIVDAQGVICDVAVGGDDFDASTCATWVGQPWADTVTVESRPKVVALLDKAKATEPSGRRWRHINHPSAKGADLPVLYSAVSYGDAGRVVAFGRDLRAASQLQQRLIEAQQSLERDYLRLRHMETRYRHLFQKVSEAILIVDAQTFKVSELNPAAEALLGAQAAKMVGDPVNACFDETHRDRVAALLGGVRLSGQSDEVRVRLGGDGRDVVLHASLFRQADGSTLLVRLTPTDGAVQPAAGASTQAMLLELVDRVPDGFVVTDLQGTVLAANAAFVEMAQLAARDQVVGQNLSRWLGRSEVDLSVLLSNLKQHGSLRLFATTVRGQYGVTSEAEISAAALPGGEHPCLGFTIRDVGRRLSNDSLKRRELPRSASQLIELVGRVPLKDIVGETTDLIEQMCIEAALELTRDNRASASEMLGLSRQSLYVKLRRYGLGDLGAENDKQ